MKHPALARVFAIVLAIVGLILLAVGVHGLKENREENAERAAYAEKFAGRIENYRALHAELQQQPDYQRTMRTFELIVSAHEKAAGRHKTDTAIYTATKGGLKMGADLINEGRAELEDAKTLLRDPAWRGEVLEGTLSQVIGSYRSKLPWLDGLAAWAVNCADKSQRESGLIGTRAGRLRLLMEVEPQPYSEPGPEPGPAAPVEEPVAPTPPEPPAFPDMGDAPPEEVQAVYAALQAEYQAASAAYMQDYAQYQQDLFAYQCAVAEAASAAEQSARVRTMGGEYFASHEAWEAECRSYRAEPAFPEAGAAIHELCAALVSLENQIRAQAPELWDVISPGLPSIPELDARGNAAAAGLSALVTTATADMSNEEYLAYADEAQGILNELSNAFFAVGATLADPSHLIVEAIEKAHLMDSVTGFVESMLKKAENQLQDALEELWYQSGQLEKDQLKLEAEKHALDREAEIVAYRTKSTDALKDLRSRHNAARLLLVNVPEIKNAMTDEESLPAAAERYLADYRSETDSLYRGRRIVCALAIAGGAAGVLGVPAAYELVRKRFWLITPVLVCILCSAAAATLNVRLGQGRMYIALATAILAFIQLLIVLPKRKKAKHEI